MHDDRDDLADALHGLADDLPARDADAPVHGQRACPICGQLMLVEQLSAVEIDTCPSHGIWLDHDELASVLSTTTKHAPRPSRRRTIELMRQAKREGKVSGALLGFWSLLLD